MADNLLAIYFRANLRAVTEFRLDFLLSNLSMLITNATFMGAIIFLAYRLGGIGSFSFEEVLMAFTIGHISYILGLNFFTNVPGFGDMVIDGELDKLMIRPISVYLQVITNRINPYTLAELITGVVFLLMNDVSRWPFIFLFCISSAIILHFSVFTLQSLPLFLDMNFAPNFFDPVVSFLFYPPDIYQGVVKMFALFIFPGAMISFGPLIGLQTPFFFLIYYGFAVLVTVLFFAVFSSGLKRYRSAGY